MLSDIPASINAGNWSTDLFSLRGLPGYIRSDNGPEFIAQKVRDWISAVGAKIAHITPGSPRENGYGESFNARFPFRVHFWNRLTGH